MMEKITEAVPDRLLGRYNSDRLIDDHFKYPNQYRNNTSSIFSGADVTVILTIGVTILTPDTT